MNITNIKHKWISKYFVCCLLTFFIIFQAQGKITKYGPPGSVEYGMSVVLTNGNYVIVDFNASANGVANAGAVYLYNGKTHALISVLTGSQSSDMVGRDGVYPLPNGNFLVASAFWRNGNKWQSGAVTWVNGSTGLNGVVSSSNSLVGSGNGDRVGQYIIGLTNGHCVVYSPDWNNDTISKAGAVTWFDANGGVVGAVDSNNSLIGNVPNNFLNPRFEDIYVLPNGNYLVRNPSWDNGVVQNVGAVTWGNGNGGTQGVFGAHNSLIGGTSYDNIGYFVEVLSNGNYVVSSQSFDNGLVQDAGAITFGNGNTGIKGVVGLQNSMIGIKSLDLVGGRATALTNGNYLVSWPGWDNGNVDNAGLVKWVDGQIGEIGLINSNNSWIGSSTNDKVGSKIFSLSNGHAVLITESWDKPQQPNAGAITWIDGFSPSGGIVSELNSIVGSSYDDFYQAKVTSLLNNHYVLSAKNYCSGPIKIGVVMWCNGNGPTIGTIDTANCLHGTQHDDFFGNIIVPLANGNYVVVNQFWNSSQQSQVGAVTWCNGNGSTVGPVSASNSLIGSIANDHVGSNGVIALSNGNYVVLSPDFGFLNSGAVTWGNGNGGTIGTINSNNSLVASYWNSRIGTSVQELNDGNYIVSSYFFNDFNQDGGALTWCNGNGGTVGPINQMNSIIGGLGQNLHGQYTTLYGNGGYAFVCSNMNGLGTVTWAKPNGATYGYQNICNTVFGQNMFNNSMPKLNPVYNYLIIDIPYENKVVIVCPESPETTIDVSGCDAYFWAGQTITTSGLYLFTGGTIEGCDSIYGLNVTINNSSSYNYNFTACNDYYFDGSVLTKSGVYKKYLMNAVGCDSVIKLNLNIVKLDTSVTQFKTSLKANQSGQQYQWVQCNPFAMISGETNYFFKPKKSGEYAVIIYSSQCVDTSSCHQFYIDTTDIEGQNNELYVFPNPSNGQVNLQYEQGFKNADIRLMHLNGEIVSEFKNINGTHFSFDISMLARGLYIIQCIDDNEVFLRKIIKD